MGSTTFTRDHGSPFLGVPNGRVGAIPNDASKRALFLQNTALCRQLSLDDCSHLADRARVRTLMQDDVVFMQGEPMREIHLVESGCVKLTHVNSNGNELILSLRTAHDLLGVPITTSGEHRTTAQSMTACTLLTWNSSWLALLISTHQQLNKNLYAIVLQELTELQERYCELTADRVERRLAAALLRLSAQIGIRMDTGEIAVNISRQELGQMVGTTLFTVSRLISKWGGLGLLSPRREAVWIIKPGALEELASLQESEPSEQTRQ